MNAYANQWMARVGAEFRASVRTWMATFTMSPEQHWELEKRAAVNGKGVIAEFHREFRQWQRRIYGEAEMAKAMRACTSYLAVAELHDSERTSDEMRGRPHYHALLHEYVIGALIRDDECEWKWRATKDPTSPRFVYRVNDDGRLRKAWKLGFTTIELLSSEREAVYVCKYLRKQDGAPGRVKASSRYGGVEPAGVSGSAVFLSEPPPPRKT